MSADDFGALQEVLTAQEEHQASYGNDDTYQKEVYGLIPDEVIVVRFVGGAGEPYKLSYHTLAGLNGSEFGDKHLCLGPGCIGCQKAIKGEKRISQASLWVAFTVLSCRPMWLIPTAKQDGTGMFNKREPLRRNSDGLPIWFQKSPNKKGEGQTMFYPNHQHPMQGHQWEEEGIRVWKGSTSPKVQNGSRIMAMIADLKTRCICGKTAGSGMNTSPARVQAFQHACSNCGKQCAAPVQGQTIVCMHCHVSMQPEEQLVCTAGCSTPARASLRHCYVQIKRVGAGNKTTYDFTVLPFSNPEAGHVPLLYRQENGAWVPNALPLGEIYKPNEAALRQAMIARGLLDHNPTTQVPGGVPGMLPGGMAGMPANPFGPAPGQAAPPPNPFAGMPMNVPHPAAPPAAAAPAGPPSMAFQAPSPFAPPAHMPAAAPVPAPAPGGIKPLFKGL